MFVFSSYQINAQTELAIRYNDISPLENHHAAVAFELIGQVFKNSRFHLCHHQIKLRNVKLFFYEILHRYFIIVIRNSWSNPI